MSVEKIGPRKRKSKHTYHLLNNSGLYHISHILLVWCYVFSPHTHITCMGHPPLVSLLWRHPQPPFLWGHPQRLRISNLTTSRPHHNLVNLHWATRYLSFAIYFRSDLIALRYFTLVTYYNINPPCTHFLCEHFTCEMLWGCISFHSRVI